tara:strand:- start:37 stop:990 length:954 start_codon:yes stop_codon:yes gene_type:complete
MASIIDTSGLVAYIEEQNFPLITKALAGGRTASMLTPQLGVKGKTKINLMDVDVTMQTDSGCTFAADGNLTYTQREIDAKPVKINMEFCPKDLEGFYLRTQLAAGAHTETIPFEEQFANYLVEKIQDELEKVIWDGSVSAGVGNLAMFDGLLIPTGSFTDCNTAAYGTALTSPLTMADAVEAVQRVYSLTPSAAVAQDDFKIFLGLDKFRLFASAIMNGGGMTGGGGQLANYQSDFDPLRMIFPGTNIEVVGVNGITGHNACYGFSLSNAFLGMDLAEDSSNLEVWYSQDDRKMKVACEFTMGTQFAYPDQVGKVAL